MYIRTAGVVVGTIEFCSPHTHVCMHANACKGMQMHANAYIHPTCIPQDWRWCRVLQCPAARCSVLQCVEVFCSVLPSKVYLFVYTARLEVLSYKRNGCLVHLSYTRYGYFVHYCITALLHPYSSNSSRAQNKQCVAVCCSVLP